MNIIPRARDLLSSAFLIGLLSHVPNALAAPPFNYQLLPVDKCELKDIEVEDVECACCQMVNQPGPIKSCLDANGDVGKIGDQLVCRMPPRELMGKPRAISATQDTSKTARRPPSEAEDGRIWGNSQWGKSANRPPPVYPNDYPEDAKSPPPPAGDFYPTKDQVKQFKSLHLKERAQQLALKKPPFGHPPPIESIKLPPRGSLPTDPTSMDNRE